MEALAVPYTAARTLVAGPSQTAPPGAGEIEMAPACVGICGTDLHILHGDMDARVMAPAVLGHEMSGRVEVSGAVKTSHSASAKFDPSRTRWRMAE